MAKKPTQIDVRSHQHGVTSSSPVDNSDAVTVVEQSVVMYPEGVRDTLLIHFSEWLYVFCNRVPGDMLIHLFLSVCHIDRKQRVGLTDKENLVRELYDLLKVRPPGIEENPIHLGRLQNGLSRALAHLKSEHRTDERDAILAELDASIDYDDLGD